MKKHIKLLLTGVFTLMLCALPAEAEEFSASEYTGGQVSDGIFTASETEAAVVYEWHAASGGMYTVSFNDASSTDCTITAEFNGGYAVNIDDITKKLDVGFDAGVNQIRLNITKEKTTSSFAIGSVGLEYTGAIDGTKIHLECNNFTAADVDAERCYENYGTDMSNRDVSLYRQFGRPAMAEFAVYAPCGGEYSAKAVMSHLGQTYTSDVNMCVNGVNYPLTTDTATRLANLTNATDEGLMKLYKIKSTVMLRQGINSIVFTAIEPRDNQTMYLFYLDCVDFTFANEATEIAAAAEAEGEYEYSVTSSQNAEYFADISLVTKTEKPLLDLADCSFSQDGESYIKLSKGTAENAFADSTVSVVSEYLEDGILYGVYRLKDSFSLGNSVYLKVGSDACSVEKIALTPLINKLERIYSISDKAVLLPGETAEISVFAVDENGYAINLDYLKKSGMLTFKSSDRNILSVDSLGNVTALDTGFAQITVTATGGSGTFAADVKFNVYNESYAFTVLNAEKEDSEVKVKLLSPFGIYSGEHVMLIAEYSDGQLIDVTQHSVDGLAKGQIMTYKMPASENEFKIISLSGIDTMEPVYETVTVR